VGARDDGADDFGRLKVSLLFYIENTSGKVLQAAAKIIYARICFANPNTPNMKSNKTDKIMQEYGKRARALLRLFYSVSFERYVARRRCQLFLREL